LVQFKRCDFEYPLVGCWSILISFIENYRIAGVFVSRRSHVVFRMAYGDEDEAGCGEDVDSPERAIEADLKRRRRGQVKAYRHLAVTKTWRER